MNNFTEQTQKLLPALFFLASANHRSRGLRFRNPRISHSDKYSAIYTHNRSCIEYRLFETCYEKPDAFFEMLEVVANTLKFYRDPSLKVEYLGKQFGFSENGYQLSRLFNTPEQLRILNAQITTLKPQEKTIAQLKKERGIHTTISDLMRTERKKVIKIRQDYQELRKRNDEVKKLPLTAEQQRDLDYRMLERNETREQAEAQVRNMRLLPTLRQFISNNLTNQRFDFSLSV